MSNEIKAVGAQPTGIKGIISGRIMNLIHSRLYKNIIRTYLLDELDLSFGNTILDIGCGGGMAVKLFYQMLGNSMICGIDHSAEMTELASSINKKGIKRGIVEIRKAGVVNIPYPDSYFNIVTAFDTINFWDDYPKALSEISRVLSDQGIFLIVNACPKEGSAWWDFVKFKNSDEYIALLEEHGFKGIRADFHKNTIAVYGRRLISE